MRRINLLVVEDHPATAGGMKNYLELMGYSVQLAGTVAAARALAATAPFDVLVCDLNLPDGTGWGLLRSLKRTRPVKAVAFSAYDEPTYREKSKAAGFLDYVVKGAPPEQLIEVIERAATGSPILPPDATPGVRRAARRSAAGA